MDRERAAPARGTDCLMPRNLHADPETRNRIRDAGFALCRRYGTRTTVAAVARQLRMSPANIYRFYPSKLALYETILELVLEKSLEVAAANAGRSITASEKLKGHVLGQYQFMRDRVSDDPALFSLLFLGTEESWPTVEKHAAQLRVIVSDLIKEGIETGEFPQQDSVLAAGCFCASVAMLCDPREVNRSTARERPVTPEILISFAIKALRYSEWPEPPVQEKHPPAAGPSQL